MDQLSGSGTGGADEPLTCDLADRGLLTVLGSVMFFTRKITRPTVDYLDRKDALMKRTVNFGSTTPAPSTRYFIRSSVLNKVVSEANATGAKSKTFVPANGTTVAVQTVWVVTELPRNSPSPTHDASATGAQETNASGYLM